MTYACVAVLVICIFVQMNFLNRALDVYNTAVVTPIYYVFFTTCVVVGSIVLYKEFFTMSKEEIFGFINGFMTIVTVIFLLNPFTGVDISLNNLRKALEDDPENGTVLDHVKNDNERKLLVDDDDDDLSCDLREIICC